MPTSPVIWASATARSRTITLEKLDNFLYVNNMTLSELLQM